MSVGAICGILSFILLVSMSSLIVKLSDKLGELVEILFKVGNQQGQRVDSSVERLPGRGKGLQDIPAGGGVSYDARYSNSPGQKDKNGNLIHVDPTGKISNESWDSNL